MLKNTQKQQVIFNTSEKITFTLNLSATKKIIIINKHKQELHKFNKYAGIFLINND